MKHIGIFVTPLLAGILCGQRPAILPGLEGPEPAPSRAAPALEPGPAPVFARAVGLDRQGDRIHGVGPDYATSFGEDEVAFTPALGGPSFPLRMRLVDVSRGSGSLPLSPTRLEHRGTTATYHRPHLAESYELRPEGMEQSFLLHRLPPGRGDLVLSLETRTELRGPDRQGDELILNAPTAGGVSIGAVTVFDAQGEQVRGATRWRDGVLQLVVPAAFVDRADLPLLVDPLYRSYFTIVGTGQDIDELGVAYEASHDVFLVAWQRRISDSDWRILAQRVRPDGLLVGNAIQVASGGSNPRFFGGVATVDGRNSFVVTWSLGRENFFGFLDHYDARARAVAAGTGSLGPVVTVAGGSGHQHPVAIAGSVGMDDQAFVVWRPSVGSIVDNPIHVAALTLDSAGTLRVARNYTVTDGSQPDKDPAISRNGGVDGRLLVAWSRYGTIRGSIIDRDLKPLRENFAISLADGHERSLPAVDGDGTSWLVAYTRAEVRGALAPNDVYCRRVVYDVRRTVAGPDGPERAVSSSQGINEFPGQMARLSESYLLSFTHGGFPVLQSLDPGSCLPCEDLYAIDPNAPGTTFTQTAVASPLTGSTKTFGNTLAVWNRIDAPALRGQLYIEQDGTSLDQGGGCGLGGATVVSCPKVGNAGFSVRLQGAPPSSPTYLLFGFQLAYASCGPCFMVPFPLTAPLTQTTPLGIASFDIPLPNDPSLHGLEVFVQWATVRNGGTCLGVLDFSDAVRFFIQN